MLSLNLSNREDLGTKAEVVINDEGKVIFKGAVKIEGNLEVDTIKDSYVNDYDHPEHHPI